MSVWGPWFMTMDGGRLAMVGDCGALGEAMAAVVCGALRIAICTEGLSPPSIPPSKNVAHFYERAS